jgi:hypothetical protein
MGRSVGHPSTPPMGTKIANPERAPRGKKELLAICHFLSFIISFVVFFFPNYYYYYCLAMIASHTKKKELSG